RDGQPIGLALYFFTYSTFLGLPTLYLEDLFVRPEARGLGAGRALLKALAHIAVRRGCGRMEWAVLDWNTPSIRFYRRLGAGLRREWILTRLTGARLRRLARPRSNRASEFGAFDLSDGPAAVRGGRMNCEGLREAVAGALPHRRAELVPRLARRDRRQPLPAAGVDQLVVEERDRARAFLPRVGDGRARPDVHRRRLAALPCVQHPHGDLQPAVRSHPIGTRALAEDMS